MSKIDTEAAKIYVKLAQIIKIHPPYPLTSAYAVHNTSNFQLQVWYTNLEIPIK